jgi:hypothetical protein
MLRRLARSFTTLCIAVCVLGPITWFVIDNFVQPRAYIQRNPDGSSTGYYLQSSATLLVRNHGYGAGPNDDTRYDPWPYIPLFAIPPALWLYTHRRRISADRTHLWFTRCCAFCPLSAAIFVGWFRRDEVLSLFTGLVALLILIIATLARALNSIPSLAQRRIPKGLCPHCGYDLRATPDPAGPRLACCPECGTPAPTTSTSTILPVNPL